MKGLRGAAIAAFALSLALGSTPLTAQVASQAGLSSGDAKQVSVTATPPDGKAINFTARVRIDTPKEREYYRHGGILQYVLRQLAAPGRAA